MTYVANRASCFLILSHTSVCPVYLKYLLTNKGIVVQSGKLVEQIPNKRATFISWVKRIRSLFSVAVQPYCRWTIHRVLSNIFAPRLGNVFHSLYPKKDLLKHRTACRNVPLLDKSVRQEAAGCCVHWLSKNLCRGLKNKGWHKSIFEEQMLSESE